MGDTPKDHAKRGGRFAFAFAGIHDDEALLIGFRRHDLIARGLLFRHFHRVAVVGLWVICHGGHPLIGVLPSVLRVEHNHKPWCRFVFFPLTVL
jgi:hypothetical protein